MTKGEEFTIAKYGVPIARLVPVEKRVDEMVGKIFKGDLIHRNALDKALEKIKELEGTDK
ncbi:hypothetical protein WA1_19970 [Scytonema hofmannii PCC 7110]|uniref:Uncharacterized protein n=1 Tax=Scytonema hofmannii PCC 7110 TaxID=128403 RepID=A0A139XC33_9CYAN|nr:hypothetical protein [Scytonema hofmannii]KYC42258.1 hypothetical protein WA1_19970 [Scytonema hofmannii PCC 7110]